MTTPTTKAIEGTEENHTPLYINKWNWGAFAFTWIWAISNRVWIGLLSFIPVVGFIMRFVLAVNGNEWAWEAKNLKNAQQFDRTQKRWNTAGIIFLWGIATIIFWTIILAIVAGAPKTAKEFITYHQQQESASTDSPSPKCSTEGPLTICDLSFNVTEKFNESRNAYFEEGNQVICQEIYSEGLTEPLQIPGPVSISNTPQMCVSDWGYIWIDPTIEIGKYYGSILRNDYESNYYLPQQYNSCIWTYSDGSASVPYVEVLDSTGPNHGYEVSAFCRADGNSIDIYTYND